MGLTMQPVLETIALDKWFGGIHSINDVSFQIEKGARRALIGPNGAGKTTIINLLTGVFQPNSGQILLDGADITNLKPYSRVKRGMVRTFQINQLFGEFTPLETLVFAVSEHHGAGWDLWQPVAGKPQIVEEAVQILVQFQLVDVMNERTAILPYGKQRLLEIAVALACRPTLLLLDEPAAGIPESERRDILASIVSLPADVSVLLIEHDMDFVFNFANRISVLVNGTLFVEGSPKEIERDPRVKAVYLGESAHD